MPELTNSTREAARRIGVSDTAIHKAERAGRIAREPDGQWDIDKTRRRLTEIADPMRSPLAVRDSAEGTPFARLKVAQLALKVEAQRFSLDETNAALGEIGSTMRDALLNWPARVSGLIAAEISVDPHLLQTILQSHINDLLSARHRLCRGKQQRMPADDHPGSVFPQRNQLMGRPKDVWNAMRGYFRRRRLPRPNWSPSAGSANTEVAGAAATVARHARDALRNAPYRTSSGPACGAMVWTAPAHSGGDRALVAYA